MDQVLCTERLALRRFAATGADVDNLLALDGDARVMRYLDGALKAREEIERRTLPGLLEEYARHPDFGAWAAEARNGGGFVGWFCLRPVAPTPGAMVEWPSAPAGDTRVVMLGYRLRYEAWGFGYATEGARASVERAFGTTGGGGETERVVATTMAVNAGSRRVLAKAGLRYLRTVHLDWPDPLPGNEHGDVEYQIGREEWEARAR